MKLSIKQKLHIYVLPFVQGYAEAVMIAVVRAVSFQDRLFPLSGVISEVSMVDMPTSYVGWFFY